MIVQQTEFVNIGSRDRQLRLALGIICLAVGVALVAYFLASGVAGWWRAPVFIPFALGLVLVMEARKGVCPMLASKGQRNFDKVFASSGVEIEDRAMADRIRRIGRVLVAQSVVGAIALTVIYLLIPA